MTGPKLFWTIFGAVFLGGAASAVAGTKDLPIIYPSYRDVQGEMIAWIFRGSGHFRTPEINGSRGFSVEFESSKSKRYVPFRLKVVTVDGKRRTTLVPLNDPKKRVSGKFEFRSMPPFYLEIEGRMTWRVDVLSGVSISYLDDLERRLKKIIQEKDNLDNGLTPVSWRVKHLGFQGVRCCLLS